MLEVLAIIKGKNDKKTVEIEYLVGLANTAKLAIFSKITFETIVKNK